MSYSKLHSTIVNSSLWTESDAVRILFVTLLAMCDKDGCVYGSRPGLDRIAMVNPDDAAAAWGTLLSRDKHSSDKMRAPENGGRRIEEIPGGFRILNFLYYRGLRNDDDRREQNRIAQAKFKAKVSQGKPSKATESQGKPKEASVSHGNPQKAHTEAEAEAETEAGKREARLSPPRAKFVKPTIEEVRLAASKSGLPELEADKFFNHYEANGWVQGRAPVKSWPHCLAKWKLNQGTYGNSTQNPKPNPRNAAMGPGHTDYGAAARERANRTREGTQG